MAVAGVSLSVVGAALASPLCHRPWCCPRVAIAGAAVASPLVVLVLLSCRPCITARGAALTSVVLPLCRWCWCCPHMHLLVPRLCRAIGGAALLRRTFKRRGNDLQL